MNNNNQRNNNQSSASITFVLSDTCQAAVYQYINKLMQKFDSLMVSLIIAR